MTDTQEKTIRAIPSDLNDKITGATMYAERALYTAESLLDEYFQSLSIANDPHMMAFYYDNARIMADIVQDYCRQTLDILKTMKDSKGEAAA